MALIQLRADLIIQACEKYLIEYEPIKRKIRTAIGDLKDIGINNMVDSDTEGRMIAKRIKKLAEYSITPPKGSEYSELVKSLAKDQITMWITHNDFELIGEFL